MKQTHLLISILTTLLVSLFLGGSARAAAITVQVIATFDYPGAESTQPFTINDNNEIAGLFSTSAGISGFTRSANGQFSPPIVDPDDKHGITVVFGINNSGTVCGYYFGTDNYHGLFFSNGTYTTYDVPGKSGTKLMGINDAGDFVGVYFDPVLFSRVSLA